MRINHQESFILLLFYITLAAGGSVNPSQSISSQIKSGIGQVLNLNLTSSSTYISTINFPSAFTAIPRLAYGLKQYRGMINLILGNDSIYNEGIEVTKQSLGLSSFSLKIRLQTWTRVKLVAYSFIAIDSGFNHHLNAFFDVLADNGGSAWDAIDNFTQGTNTYTGAKDYSALCSSSPSTSYPCSFTSVTHAKIVVFLSAFFLKKKYNPGAMYFQLGGSFKNTTHFELTAITKTLTALQFIRFGIVIYDENQLQSNQYYPVQGAFNVPSSGYVFGFNEDLSSNFIMSVLYFDADGHDCGIHYTWNFTGNNFINIPAFSIYPGSQGSCTLNNALTTYFYIYVKICNNPSYPYYRSTDDKCYDSCPSYTTADTGTKTCKDCGATCSGCSISDINTCTACNSATDHRQLASGNCVCQTGYLTNSSNTTGPCISCSTVLSYCATCNSSPLSCTSCTSGYSLRNNGSCQVCSNFNCLSCNPSSVQCYSCDTGSDYYLNGSSLQCEHCSTTISYCQTCTSLTVCSACDTVNDFRQLVSGSCTCKTGYAQPTTPGSVCSACSDFISNCLQCSSDGSICTKCQTDYSLFPNNTCQPCSTLYCVDCSQTSTTCFQCDAANGYYLNGNICESCTNNIPFCQTCTSLTVCSACDTTNDFRQLVSGSCICKTGYAQPTTPGSVCSACSDFISNCLQCSSDGSICTKCQTDYSLFPNNTCQPCSTLYCVGCSQTSTTCTSCDTTNDFRQLVSGSCICKTGYAQPTTPGSVCSACSDFISNCLQCSSDGSICTKCQTDYSLFPNNTCQPCSTLYCVGCSQTSTTCTSCDTTNDFRQLVSGSCICKTGYAQPTTPGSVCSACSDFISNCLQCSSDGSICTKCQTDYSLFPNNTCQPCSTLYCVDCSQTSTTCFQCDAANYYFKNLTTFFCELCTLSNCLQCTSLTSCKFCDQALGYSVNSMGQCQQCSITCGCDGYGMPKINGICTSTCGDSLIRLGEECDDGNIQNQDGCSSDCKVQQQWTCINQPSCCYLDSINDQFWLEKVFILKSKDRNHVTVTLNLKPQVPILTKISLNKSVITNLTSKQIDQSTYNIQFDSSEYRLKISFDYLQTLENQSVLFYFQTLVTTDHCQSTPDAQLIVSMETDNNLPLVLFTDRQYQAQKALQVYWYTLEGGSYLVLLGSILSCKIVGLELFGVLQLAFFSMSQYDDVNIYMTPLLSMKHVNGYNMIFSQQSSETISKRLLIAQENGSVPKRISSMQYEAIFINNCNLMLWILLASILIGIILYILSLLIFRFSILLHKVAQYILKEVLLTLLMFNIFNLSFSVSLHFTYASPSSEYYVVSTILAIIAILIIFGVIVGFLFSEDTYFGQFKRTFKKGRVNQIYCVLTMIYRISLGIYLAVQSENDLTSVIILSFSIFFLIYNFVNLPYKEAIHNYRANLCHLSQFAILFIAMFYRSMKSPTPIQTKSRIVQPVLILLCLVSLTLIASLLVLCYELNKFISSRIQRAEKVQNEVIIKNVNATQQTIVFSVPDQIVNKKQKMQEVQLD